MGMVFPSPLPITMSFAYIGLEIRCGIHTCFTMQPAKGDSDRGQINADAHWFICNAPPTKQQIQPTDDSRKREIHGLLRRWTWIQQRTVY